MTKQNKQLSTDDVKHIAYLAKLDIKEEKIKKFQKQLSQILNFVNHLAEVDTKDVTPTSQVTGLENVFREDVIKPSLSQVETLSNASRKHKGYFVVDAIFE